MSVTVGDKVLLPEYGGTKIEIDSKEYTILRESDIVAKFGKEWNYFQIRKKPEKRQFLYFLFARAAFICFSGGWVDLIILGAEELWRNVIASL